MQMITPGHIENHASPICLFLQKANCIPVLLATFFALSSANPALATEDWLTVPTASADITFFIDKGNLEHSGKLVRFWEKIVYTKLTVKDEASGKLIKEKKIRRIMNCQERTQGLLHGVTYGEHGSFITSISLDEGKTSMTAIPLNTIASAEFAIVCANTPANPEQNSR